MKRAIIIGAGYAGIALANLLAKSGITVDVFEKNEVVGGRIAVVKQDGFTFETGPSWYLMPEVFEHYYELFGTRVSERLDLQRLTPGYRVFFDTQQPITVYGSLERDTQTFEAIERGAGQTLRRYVADARRTYDIALRHFLYTNFERLSELFSPEVMANAPRLVSLATRPLDDHVKRYFKDGRLQRILEYHSVFLGSSPFDTPSLYSLMSTLDFTTGVYYPAAGMYALVDDLIRLGDSSKISYHCNAEVVSIHANKRSATSVTLADGSSHTADVIISAADLHYTETTLLPESAQTYPETYWKRRQPGPSGLVISLGVRGKLPQLLHHNLYFVDDWKGNFAAIYGKKIAPESASMYVCNPSKSDPTLAPKQAENLFILVPLPAGVDVSAEDTRKLAARYASTFARVIGVPDLESRIISRHIVGPKDYANRYHAWEYNAFGGESHLLRQSAVFRTKNKSRKLENLYYVGAGALPGIGLPMCLISAELTYKRIMGIKRGAPLAPDA